MSPYLEPEDSLVYRLGNNPDRYNRPLLMHYDLVKRRQEQIDLCKTKAVPDIASLDVDVLDNAIVLHSRDVSHTFIEQLATLGMLSCVAL